MKLCFICSEYPPAPHGGIGTLTQTLGRALVRRGHEVRVLGVYSGASCSPQYAEDQGVRLWRLCETAAPFAWVRARYKLFRTLQDWSLRGEIDLIEVPDWQGWAAGWPKLPVPVVTRANGSSAYFAMEMNRETRRVNAWLEEASLRRSDFWAAASRYTEQQTRRVFRLRSPADAILYNPVQLPECPSGSKPRSGVLYSGTLTEKKGIVSLIQAWPSVLRECPGARLRIFGKDGTSPRGGSMRAFLETGMDGAVARSVTFHGHVDRDTLVRALHEARAAVFPSYSEAFAIAPLEAMACGCPTIYTRRASGPELIEPEHNGLLIDPDRPEAIAEAIIRLLRDDGLASALGQAGCERVRQRFSLDRLVVEDEEFYRECREQFRRRDAKAA